MVIISISPDRLHGYHLDSNIKPIHLTLPTMPCRQVQIWCEEHIGFRDINWYFARPDDQFDFRVFIVFNSEEDKVKFILRWL